MAGSTSHLSPGAVDLAILLASHVRSGRSLDDAGFLLWFAGYDVPVDYAARQVRRIGLKSTRRRVAEHAIPGLSRRRNPLLNLFRRRIRGHWRKMGRWRWVDIIGQLAYADVGQPLIPLDDPGPMLLAMGAERFLSDLRGSCPAVTRSAVALALNRGAKVAAAGLEDVTHEELVWARPCAQAMWSVLLIIKRASGQDPAWDAYGLAALGLIPAGLPGRAMALALVVCTARAWGRAVVEAALMPEASGGRPNSGFPSRPRP